MPLVGTDPKGKSGDGQEPRPATLSAARLAVAVRRAAAEAGESAVLLRSEPIAIVGMGCRFPGGDAGPVTNADEYWALLEGGRSGIREMPTGRWAEARATLPKHLLLGGYLDHVDLFDAEFFGIAPREAHSIDPQQRLLLEVTWEALSDAGVAPSALSGTDAGVFLAVYNSDYARLQLHEDAVMDSQSGIGAAHSVASGRLSFLLNLRGPCMTVDTACSSSLVAAHLACQSLRRRECGVALVAGTSLKLLPEEVRLFEQWGMLASDGLAKTFDARADGFVPGEGCGVVVLKRLSDAVAQGDRIHAVIRGSAVNHDGRSSVLTAPNGPAQEAVMRAALRDGQVTAGDVAYVETHGTGTSLGDPIEVEALDAVYGGSESGTACLLGAVKTNFGHLEAAAGVAGLIKTALVLEHGAIPRNLNFETLNPQIRLGEKSRLQLATERRAWPRVAGQTRFAGVSSFGLGGTNAHVILEEAPGMPAAAKAQNGRDVKWSLPVSAHTAEGLRQIGHAYVELLRRPGVDLGVIARSAARGRDHGAFRVAVSGSNAADAAEALETRLTALDLDALQRAVERGAGAGKMAFVFSGQGSLWVGALAALAEDFPKAAEVLAECERITQEAAGWSLKTAAADAAALADTAKAQPVLFALQVGLLQVFESWGIVPDAVAGHSVGEVAAAVAAGVLTLDEGMRLVLKRGRQMASAGAGRMLAAEMTLEAAGALLAEVGGVEIAAENGPRSVVFAGAPDAMERVHAVLEERAVWEKRAPSRWLDVEYAFHSAAMDGPRAALEAELAREFSRGRELARRGTQLVSTVTGALWQSGDGDAAYWGRGIRQPVRFREAVERLEALGCGTVVEIGPHPVLLRSVGETLRGDGAKLAPSGLAAMRRGQTARATLMALVGALYESGRAMDWAKVYPGAPTHAALPAYPWRRERYWLPDLPKKRNGKDSGLNDLESIWSGREVAAAFVDGRVFEAQLGTSSTPWLGEHCWRGEPVLPFTAWLEMARRAAAASTDGPVALREFAVSAKLALSAEPVVVQTLVAPTRQLNMAVKSDDAWRACAGGFWEAVEDVLPAVDLMKLRSRVASEIQPEALYALLEGAGLSYGSSFRLLRSVWAGNGCALGEIVAGVGVRDGLGLHPALLDACLQVLQAAQPESERGKAMLPVSVRSYRVLPAKEGTAASDVFALAELRRWDGGGAEADITVVDRGGVVVAQLQGLTIRRVEMAVEAIAPIWQMVWTATENSNEVEGMPGAGASLVAENSDGRLTRLRTVLEGDASAAFLSGDWDAVTAAIAELVIRERNNPGSVRRVCLLTCGAVAARPGDVMNAEQAALWGLMRSFRAEYPGIAVQIIDLPKAESAGDVFRAAEWMRGAGLVCAEIAVRDGVLYLPQLKQTAQSGIEGVGVERRLEIVTPGLLETLREEALEVAEPGAGEVQIAVEAHGLNFRDVLTAMGTYAGVSAPMGAECAGVVVKAGVGATLRPGVNVVAFAPASLGSLVNVAEAYCFAKPTWMSWAEAATVPVAFLTAQYGFTRLAGLKAGDVVLVHVAAGGLGQAAVQLARRVGSRVMATAGSEAKRAWLRAQGVEHVFDSRSAEFAEDVLRVTDGRGVDVVLNSLAGEKIGSGLRALARGGAFLEVGKRDIWSVERVKAVRPDVRYLAFDLGEVALREPELIQTMLGEIFAGVRTGELLPLPLRTYAIREAEQAFRWMAGGRHIGKLVLMREPRLMSREAWLDGLRAGSALITGGTGALGLAAARWLLEQGVRWVVLVSRSGGGDAALALAAEFAGRVAIKAADVADLDAMRDVLERTRVETPLRVVIHAAGEVRDGLLAEATAESLSAALRTKVEGAKVLAELTDPTNGGDDLLATVYYSSLTGVVGSAGQAGYAAANAYLDGLAEERSARGLRTLSVDWGAWAAGGMTERLSEVAAVRVARQGIRRMAPGAGLAAMEEAILSGRPQVAVADVDWEAFAAQFPGGAPIRAFMEEFLPVGRKQTEQSGKQAGVKNTGVEASSLDGQVRNYDATEIAAIAGALKTERLPRIETYVRGAARKVLGLSASRPIPAETALQDMGLDSLMALELRNVLAQAMGRPLSATLLFDYPTVRGLAGYLLGVVEAAAIGEKQTAGAKAPSSALDEIVGTEAPAYPVSAARIGDGSIITSASVERASSGDAVIKNASIEGASGRAALMKNASMKDSSAKDASTFEAELAAMSDAEAEELLLAELERKGAS